MIQMDVFISMEADQFFPKHSQIGYFGPQLGQMDKFLTTNTTNCTNQRRSGTRQSVGHLCFQSALAFSVAPKKKKYQRTNSKLYLKYQK